jgi:Fe-S oxidoreductase
MYQTPLAEYESAIAACRFCPMCKPASDVANVTCLESHSTRSRAILLWRWLRGFAEPSARDIELLFQSTLDSISESWCVSHLPVSGYALAARRRVLAEGRLPGPVAAALERTRKDEVTGEGDALFVAGEIWELTDRGPWLTAVRRVLEFLGVKAVVAVVGNGVVDFALGDNARACVRGSSLAQLVAERRPKTIIADGPDTLFALARLHPELGMPTAGALLVSLTELLAAALSKRRVDSLTGRTVLCHDARSTFFLADKLAGDAAIQPGFTGPEEALGQGAAYDHLRNLARAAGGQLVSGVWLRTLARSAGSDDGLWLTYPKLAERVGLARLRYARRLTADLVLTDSPIAAAHLGRVAAATSGEPAVRWVGSLIH